MSKLGKVTQSGFVELPSVKHEQGEADLRACPQRLRMIDGVWAWKGARH